ncbi:hypothetical protein BDD12DRAFT_846405 [Trichophaea hybrida]|nr:hypothetical protein BDD12DRAFT_846405 [Trichophaea hybrida]
MCRKTQCSTCSGVTWFGRCGLHIAQVLDPIPAEQWCTCPKPEGSGYPPIGPPPPSSCRTTLDILSPHTGS